MRTASSLAPARRVSTALFLVFALVLSLFPFADRAAAHLQDAPSPYLRAVFDDPRYSSAPYEEVGNLARMPALPAPAAPFLPAPGMAAYAELDTLFVIYTSTAAGGLNPGDVARLKAHATETARFIWRQSHFRFLLRLTFLVINTYKDMTEFTLLPWGGYWLNPTDDDGDGISVEADLLARGVTANQYDSINYLWAHNYDTVPAAYGGLGGVIEWQLGTTGITENPVFQLSGSEKFSTAFPHEIQHTIDFMMEASGYPEYFHADRPWDYQGAFGEDWSFWAYQMKHWPVPHWLVLIPPWGKIIQVADADGDGVPDSGAGLPITEGSLGSSPMLRDSDNDGFADRQEATVGLFRNTDLNRPDSDGDHTIDSLDPEPLYPINTRIRKKNRALNGNPAGWDLLTAHLEQTNTAFAPVVYANWNSDYLFLMIQVDSYAGIHVKIDAKANGWFEGKDNYEIAVDPSYPEPTDPLIVAEAHIWDSSDSTIATTVYPIWDDDPNYPFGRLITKQTIGRYARSNGDGYQIQIAIPANPRTGLVLRHGKRIGLNFTYGDIGRVGGLEAETFERNDFAYVTLWDPAPGFHVSGRSLLDANGNNFVMRGVNHPHTWFPAQTGSLKNIKAKGANAVRVVLSSGHVQGWTKNSAGDVANVINLCKTNKLVCVLEVHDTTGYDEEAGAATLAQAVGYWKSIKSALIGQEAYVIINLGNEPFGNQNPARWTAATKNAILAMRSAGFQHTLMVDAPNWGQDWQFIMRDNAADVFNTDPQKNTIFSIHMYGVFDTPVKVQDYVSAFVSAGLPLVIGEYGWKHSDGNPDEDAIMSIAQAQGIGYLGWSWSGNCCGGAYLDMVQNFNPNRMTWWGARIFGGENGICPTSEEASVFGGSTGARTCAFAATGAGSNDGWILESTETSNQGGSVNRNASTFNLGDDDANRQYRAILHFNTSLVPNNAVITRVRLMIRLQGVAGTNPFTTHGGLRVDIRKPYFGPGASLDPGDFQAAASKSAVGTIGPVPVNGWHVAQLNVSAFPFVNLAGATQFRLRFAKDDNNDLGADIARFYSGNAPPANRPILIIEYTMP